jgi:addiction module HigA family antidote
MSNRFEFHDKAAFHPGYYIKELVEDSGLSQQDFARRLSTTPKNLSILIRGEQSLSPDMAMKLSRMTGTSIEFWLNLQQKYDALKAEKQSEEEIEKEKEVFQYLDYSYFKDNFKLPDYPNDTEKQIIAVRQFLHVASLSVLINPDLCAPIKDQREAMNTAETVQTNVMVLIGINEAVKIRKPKDIRQFTKTSKNEKTVNINSGKLQQSSNAGTIYIQIPSLPKAKIKGFKKKVGGSKVIIVGY